MLFISPPFKNYIHLDRKTPMKETYTSNKHPRKSILFISPPFGNYINLEVLNITKCLGYSDYKIKMNNIEKKVVNEFLNIIINDITHLYK